MCWWLTPLREIKCYMLRGTGGNIYLTPPPPLYAIGFHSVVNLYLLLTICIYKIIPINVLPLFYRWSRNYQKMWYGDITLSPLTIHPSIHLLSCQFQYPWTQHAPLWNGCRRRCPAAPRATGRDAAGAGPVAVGVPAHGPRGTWSPPLIWIH